MQLTLHADYALRVLLYLGTLPPGQVASTAEISTAYGISRNHLVRVVQTLAKSGYVVVTGGRQGGVALARDPEQIRLGDVVRHAETNLRVVECFDKKTNTCPIISICELKPVIAQALDAFLAVMDSYTLAAMLDKKKGSRLARIFETQR